MARKRMIDPSIWEDPEFASLTRDARLLFIGLMSNADDEGYLRGDPGSLRRLVFGFDDDIKIDYVKKLLGEIASAMRSVHVYYVDNQAYIHLAKWFVYQKQQKDRIVDSVFPKCSTCYANGKQTPSIQVAKDTPLLKEVDKVSKLSNSPPVVPQVSEIKKTEGFKPLRETMQDRVQNYKPNTDTSIDQPEWQRTTIYYAEELGFVNTLTSDEMERFLKAGKDAIEFKRKTANFHQAYNYCIDHPQKDPHQILRLFFKIYENGLQKNYGQS